MKDRREVIQLAFQFSLMGELPIRTRVSSCHSSTRTANRKETAGQMLATSLPRLLEVEVPRLLWKGVEMFLVKLRTRDVRDGWLTPQAQNSWSTAGTRNRAQVAREH